jgi:hypothetical protein
MPRMARTLLLLLAALTILPACGGARGAGADAWPFAAPTMFGNYRVTWRTADGAPIPNNEPFRIDVRVAAKDGSPVTGAQVVFQGDMPGHGHGMLREPRTTEVGDGRYRIDGVLLHMAGRWVVHLDVIEGGRAERSTFTLDVE